VELWGPKGTLEQLIPEEKHTDLEPITRAAVDGEIREAMRSYAKRAETQLPAGFYIALGFK